MTRLLSIALFIAMAVSLAAQAQERASSLGNSHLTFWFDGNGGIASVEIDELSDHSIRGQSSFGNGMLNLKREGATLKGFADDGFVELTCSATECNGIVGSDTTRATATQTGDVWEVKGSMNHVSIHAKVTPTKIEVHADGSLVLRKDKKHEGVWNGTGYLGGDFDSRFTARLESKGTLRDRQSDLGLFLIYMVSPLVRD